MRERRLSQWLVLLFLAVPGLALSQRGQQGRTLVIAGQPGQAPIVQLSGRSLVDVEELARLTNGTLAFKGSKIILALPGSSAVTPAPLAGPAPAPQVSPAAAPLASAPPVANAAPVQGFSKGFLMASIEAMGQIREWRSALAQAVQGSSPVTQQWISAYSGRANQSRSLASVAAATNADRQADQLLGNQLNNMQALSQKFIDARSNQQDVPQDSLDGDPLFKQILTCARAMAEMQVTNQFQDDNSCH